MSHAGRPVRPWAMRRAIAILLAVTMGGNGLVMLAAGRWWYGAVAGVPETGPFNPHFVKDIGAAYLVVGAAFAWLAARPAPEARGAAMAAAAFLALHSGIHLAEAVGAPPGSPTSRAIFPASSCRPCWPSGPSPPHINQGSHAMLKALLDRVAIRPFERAFNYDAGYMRDVLAASPASFLRFSMLSGLVQRRAAPAEALAAAGIAATLREDCGPCTQIGVDIAERSGVRAEVLKAILAGDTRAMG